MSIWKLVEISTNPNSDKFDLIHGEINVFHLYETFPKNVFRLTYVRKEVLLPEDAEMPAWADIKYLGEISGELTFEKELVKTMGVGVYDTGHEIFSYSRFTSSTYPGNTQGHRQGRTLSPTPREEFAEDLPEPS